MKYYLLVIFCLLSLPVWGVFESRPTDARALGLGQAFVAVSDNSQAIFSNSAGLTRLTSWEAGSTYSKLFGLSELGFSALSLGGPGWRQWPLGLGITSFGGSLYQENQLLVGSARRLGEKFSLGLTGRLGSVNIGGETVRTGMGLAGGALWQLHQRLRVGGCWQEIFSSFSRDWTRPTQEYGLAFQVNPNAMFSADVLLAESFPPLWRLGQEVWLNQYFALRGGFNVNPDRFFAGLGFCHAGWRIDYALYTHEVLDLTHLVTVNLAWGKGIASRCSQ